MPSVVQINFDYDIAEDELDNRSSTESAKIFHKVNGLRWKLWLRDPETRDSAGIYLFDDRASAEAYLAGPIADMIKQMPDTANHSFKVFDVREELTAVTGGPLKHHMLDAVS